MGKNIEARPEQQPKIVHKTTHGRKDNDIPMSGDLSTTETVNLEQTLRDIQKIAENHRTSRSTKKRLKF